MLRCLVTRLLLSGPAAAAAAAASSSSGSGVARALAASASSMHPAQDLLFGSRGKTTTASSAHRQHEGHDDDDDEDDDEPQRPVTRATSRGINAYNLFVKNFKRDYPAEASAGQNLIKAAAARYRSLSDAEKAKLKAEADKLKAALPPSPPKAPSTPAPEKRTKPAKTPAPYNLFIKDFKQTWVSGECDVNFLVAAAEQYRGLPEPEKQRYKDKAAALKQAVKQAESTEKLAAKAARRAKHINCYTVFFTEQQPSFKATESDPKEVIRKVAKKWGGLSDAEKAKYQAAAKQLQLAASTPTP